MSFVTDVAAPQAADHGLGALVELAAARGLRPGVARFLFLRHGETDGNVSKRFQPADISLNARGNAQAVAAVGALQGVKVRAIHASTMQRAWETAGIVGAALGLPRQPAPALRERWFGDWVGLSSAHLDWRQEPPGGERLADFVHRTIDGFAALLQEGEDALLVAHGGNLHVLAGCLGIRVDASLLRNALPLVVEQVAGGWSLRPVAAAAVPSGAGASLGW